MKKVTCCPRCNWKSLEKLRTYSYCSNCFYVEDNILQYISFKDLHRGSPDGAYLTNETRSAMLELLNTF